MYLPMLDINAENNNFNTRKVLNRCRRIDKFFEIFHIEENIYETYIFLKKYEKIVPFPILDTKFQFLRCNRRNVYSSKRYKFERNKKRSKYTDCFVVESISLSAAF